MACRLCQNSLKDLIDFGSQPLCNRFLASELDTEQKYPLVLSQCEVCELIQIREAIAPHEMCRRYEWIQYREPEGHLDNLANWIAGLPGAAQVLGLSVIDESLLSRLAKRGLKTKQLDMVQDLGIQESLASVESIQEKINPNWVLNFVQNHGPMNIVLGRYVAEHAHDLGRFLAALKKLISPKGYVVLEVPDCESGFLKNDVSLLWEEHVSYFTKRTLASTMKLAGYDIIGIESYFYTMQNSMVVVAQQAQTGQ